MPKLTDGYLDIRIHVTFEEESYTLDDEEYFQRFMIDASPEIIGWQSIEDHELQGIAETLSQMDRHQEMLCADIPNEIYNIIPEDPFNE